MIAAELGQVFAAEDFGRLLDESDPFRWIWSGRAAFFLVCLLARLLILFRDKLSYFSLAMEMQPSCF